MWVLILLAATCVLTQEVADQNVSKNEVSYSNKAILCSVGNGSSCPPGLFCVNGECQCGVYPNFPDYIIHCNGTNALLLREYCASFDETLNVTSVGICLQTSSFENKTGIYFAFPRSGHELNDQLCGFTNRTGTLCGRCLPDHYPLAYSYDTTCIPCTGAHWKNWLKYFMAAYLPLTFLFAVMVLCKINITPSSHLFAVALYCQTITMPVILRAITLAMQQDVSKVYYITTNVFLSLYAIWNLDFFRLFYSDLCLGIGILPTLALDYAIAVYPLFLVLLTCLAVKLYDRNFKLFMLLLTPFKALFAKVKWEWNVRTAMVNAFATFFFLSNIKFLSVSFDFLIPTKVYWLHRDHVTHSYGLYFAADVEYFGKEHLPYALLAIVVLSVFVVLPLTVLTLYPFRFFQKFLNLFRVRWYILHTFVDVFYGCFKDGTEPRTHDCRCFVSGMFTLRFLQFLLYFIPDKLVYNILVTMILTLYVTLFAVLQPYKPPFSHFNAIHLIFFQALSVFSLAILGNQITIIQEPNFLIVFLIISMVVGLLPVLFFLASMAYSCRRIVQRVRAWRAGYGSLPHEDDQLPDRVNNSGEYHDKNLSYFCSK